MENNFLEDNITKNFKWKEFFYSVTAEKNNINNLTNSSWVLNNIEDLTINVLQPIRDTFGGIKITSGFRSYSLNQKIGGSLTSFHSYGMAADIISLNNISLINILEFIYDDLKYSELIAEYFPDGWIHVAYQKHMYTKTIKVKDEKHNYFKTDLNYVKSLFS